MRKKPGKRGGKRANAGRKTKVVEQNLHALLNECVPGEQLESIIRKLGEDAGHASFKIRHEARKLLLAYKYGKPVDRVELSGEGGGPIPITIIEPVKPNA
jgi:hypothetical protein